MKLRLLVGLLLGLSLGYTAAAQTIRTDGSFARRPSLLNALGTDGSSKPHPPNYYVCTIPVASMYQATNSYGYDMPVKGTAVGGGGGGSIEWLVGGVKVGANGTAGMVKLKQGTWAAGQVLSIYAGGGGGMGY